METLIANKFYQVSVDIRNVGFKNNNSKELFRNNSKANPCLKQKRNVTPLF